MRKQTLFQRLVAGLAKNEAVQPKPTEIWRRLKSLTPREVDVLCYVLGGQLNREIAAELNITETTVKVHRGRVMEKLGVQSTSQPLFSRRRHQQLLRKRQHSGGRPADSRSR